MTNIIVTDEQLASLARRQHDLFRRVREGSLPVQQVLDGLQMLIEGQFTAAQEVLKLPVWKMVTIGEQKNSKACAKTLEKTGFKISRWAGDILGKTKFSLEKHELDLVRISVADLGFSKGASLKDIYARAKEKGLDVCPAEVGPALRLSYKDQPLDEWLLVAMEPLPDSNGDLHVFRVDHDGDDLWLYAGYGSPDDVWHADYTFVFVRRK